MLRTPTVLSCMSVAALVVGCRPSTGDGGTRPDARDDAPSDASAADAAPGRTSCPLADGHPCNRWVRTDPADEYACLGYDNINTGICINEMPTTSCELADGHPCNRWVLTEPNAEYACLGYDNIDTGVCINEMPTTSCELADGHPCSRWVLTEPNAEYACLGYDNIDTAVCQ